MLFNRALLAGLTLACAAFVGSAYAACQPLARDQDFAARVLASDERRTAFVAGNGAYEALPAVPQAVRDARAMASRLQALGFDVTVSTDADAAGLQSCFETFLAGRVRPQLQLFYFSGQGVQIGAGNYLAATNARAAGGLASGFLPLSGFIEAMAPRGGARLVVLDAARIHPLVGQALSFPGEPAAPVRPGLSPEEMGSQTAMSGAGQLIAFSATPNSEGAAETGARSLFTDALVERLGAPGYSIQRTLSEAARAVGERTNFARAPWTRASLTADVFLNGRQDMVALQAASEAFAAQSERLLSGPTGDRNRALAEALKGLPENAAPNERAFAAARRAYQIAARSVILRLPIARGAGDVSDAVVSPDADRIAIVNGASFSLWTVASPRRLVELRFSGDATTPARVAFSADSRSVAVEDRGARQIVVLNAGTGAIAARIANTLGPRALDGLEIANGGRRVLAHNAADGAAVWDTSTNAPVFRQTYPELINQAATASVSGAAPALRPDGGEVAFLDYPTPHTAGPRAFAPAPEPADGNRRLIQSNRVGLHRYDLDAGRIVWSSAPASADEAYRFAMRYSPRGTHLLIAEPFGPFPNYRLSVWSLGAGRRVAQAGPFTQALDAVTPDETGAVAREAVFSFPAMTPLDPHTLLSPPVINRVFSSDGGEFGFRTFSWPGRARDDAAALEAARRSLPPALASQVQAQRLRYSPAPPPR